MSKYSIERPYCEGSKASHRRSNNFWKKIKRERKRKKKRKYQSIISKLEEGITM